MLWAPGFPPWQSPWGCLRDPACSQALTPGVLLAAVRLSRSLSRFAPWPFCPFVAVTLGMLRDPCAPLSLFIWVCLRDPGTPLSQPIGGCFGTRLPGSHPVYGSRTPASRLSATSRLTWGPGPRLWQSPLDCLGLKGSRVSLRYSLTRVPLAAVRLPRSLSGFALGPLCASDLRPRPLSTVEGRRHRAQA